MSPKIVEDKIGIINIDILTLDLFISIIYNDNRVNNSKRNGGIYVKYSKLHVSSPTWTYSRNNRNVYNKYY